MKQNFSLVLFEEGRRGAAEAIALALFSIFFCFLSTRSVDLRMVRRVPYESAGQRQREEKYRPPPPLQIPHPSNGSHHSITPVGRCGPLGWAARAVFRENIRRAPYFLYFISLFFSFSYILWDIISQFGVISYMLIHYYDEGKRSRGEWRTLWGKPCMGTPSFSKARGGWWTEAWKFFSIDWSISYLKRWGGEGGGWGNGWGGVSSLPTYVWLTTFSALLLQQKI